MEVEEDGMEESAVFMVVRWWVVCLGFIITALQYQVVISAVFCLFCDLIPFIFYFVHFHLPDPSSIIVKPFSVIINT